MLQRTSCPNATSIRAAVVSHSASRISRSSSTSRQVGKSEDEPVDPRVCAKRRRKCGRKKLETLLKTHGLEEGYTPEMPSTSAVPIAAAREIASQAHQLCCRSMQINYKKRRISIRTSSGGVPDGRTKN
ncbi:uncharacterized protein LOC116167730 [Photinus pyralis]|uniref:uncharacterized protein LOC116167730 n=1 Tax=Photinus pyralis TaxID=7054 RepID=UPI0012672A82|nr:uncharacterized protein LOC116167730 [Photinus pyralis]